eukprot:c25211_g2_i1 orf=47-3391(+)
MASPSPYRGSTSLLFLLLPLLLCVVFCAPKLAIAASPPPSSPVSSTNLTLSALLALKASISADPTGLLASWDVSSNFCTWQGILCSNNSQQVKGLLLNSRQLNGTLPPQLADLQGLSYLNVSNNSLHGPIPTRLGELAPSLTHLDLSANNFDGSIPSSLAGCTLLQYIDLNSNSLTSQFPSFVTNFTLLGYLDLSSNSITGELPSDIGLLSSLQFLQVYSTQLNGTIPPSLMNCSNLVWLDLADNFLSGPLPSDWTKLASTLQQLKIMNNMELSGSIPPSLGNCTLLTVLSLQNQSLTGDIPTSLGKLTLLQDLRLYYNFLTGPIPPSLMNCTLLVFLELSNNNLSGVIPHDIGRLTHVQWLTFSGNPLLEGPIPDSIGECAQLQVLGLSSTAVGGSLPTSLFNLTNLQGLKLHNCRLSGRLPEQVRQLTSLQNLDISNNGFEGPIPAELGDLKTLQGLYMQENRFSGPIPYELSGCISISEMNLSSNPLSGSIPSSFAQLQTLNHLYLRNASLSGPIPDIFVSLTRLQDLDLAQNMFTGSIPISLATLDTISISLDLSDNSLTGAIPSSVGGMQMLVSMVLSGNAFTGEIPATFGDCQGMQVLDLSKNRLGGEIPASLGQMKSLQHLDLSHNELSGTLPSSLGLLNDLTFLNVSYNELEGRIPMLGAYENSSTSSFVGNPGLCGYPLSTSCVHYSNHSKKTAIIVSVCVVGGAILAAVLCACLWWWWRCCHKAEDSYSEDSGDEDLEADFNDIDAPRFKAWTAKEIKAATNNFDVGNVLGSGGVSVCYKAVMEESKGSSKKRNIVAVKRLNVRDHHGAEARRSFVNELKTICKVRHRNLVKVLGYCVEGGEVALVMEYMEGGDLDGHLHGLKECLSWEERINVAVDVAEGLLYLHHEYVQPIVHCDLKPKNILLGSDMIAKISDFGIAKLLDINQTGDMSASKFRGSFGYAAPEYAIGSRISTKADVYSYGVLVLELVTGLRPTSPRLQEEGMSLHMWVRTLQESGRTREALDKAMDSNVLQEAEELLDLGMKCSVDAPKDRPSMQVVRDFITRFKKRRLLKNGSKGSYPDLEELLKAPDHHSLSASDASKLLLDPSIQMDSSDLQSMHSSST